MKHRFSRAIFKVSLKRGILLAVISLVIAPGLFTLSNPQPVAALTDAQVKQDALKACKTTDDHSWCVTGYINGYNGQSSQAMCIQLVGGTDYNLCVKGINLGRAAKGNAPVTPPTPVPSNDAASSEAQANCKGKGGSALAACADGYDGQTTGKTKDEACKSYNGNDLRACGDAWDNSHSASPYKAPAASDSANCEDQGGKLSWILCPIFDEMSNASSWLFSNIVQPFLITPPVSTNPSDPSFQIWSNLRIYGNIFLVIALLVIVFGESIGGGLIDSYTAKKVLPRLLVAAVLINLSIYIVAFLVDFSNILGQGVGSILTAPLTHCQNGAGGNCWDFALTTGDQARVFGVGLIGLLAGGTALTGFLGAIIFNPVTGIGAVLTMAFFVLLPVFFAVLAVFITLIIRKGLILMLVLISPVAFALYCLPNTQRFFKRWWELLIEALMVYPIIVAIFGVAEILSVTILTANGISPSDLQTSGASNFIAGNLNRTLALVVAFLLQFLPLLAVPFAFRFAGSAMGRIYEAATGAGQRINKMAETRREHAKRDYQAQALASRSKVYHASRDFGDRHGKAVRFGSRWIGNRAGGYNIEGLMSAGRAEKKKMADEQINNGRDEEIRGVTVNKTLAKRQKQAFWNQTLNGGSGGWAISETGRALADSEIPEYGYGSRNGQTFYQSAGGAWVSEGDVDAGHRRWGRDQFMQQAALGYEMRKAVSDGQRTRLTDQYYDVATGPGGWGMTKGEADGAWLGSAFENQNTNLQYKYTKAPDANGTRAFDHSGFVSEIYEKRSSSAMSQMDAGSIDRLTDSWDVAQNNPEMRTQLVEVARTMQDRLAQARGGRVEPNAEDAGGPQQAISYGSGHTTASMNRFVDTVLGGGAGG